MVGTGLKLCGRVTLRSNKEFRGGGESGTGNQWLEIRQGVWDWEPVSGEMGMEGKGKPDRQRAGIQGKNWNWLG